MVIAKAPVVAMPDDSLDVRELLTVVRRRWWLVAGLPLLVGVIHILTRGPGVQRWQAQAAFLIDVPPEAVVPGTDTSAAAVADDLADDLSHVVGRDVFVEALNRRLPPGMQVGEGEIATHVSSDVQHRVIELRVTRELPAGASSREIGETGRALEQIALAAVDELGARRLGWFARLGERGAQVTLVDRPDVVALVPTLGQRLGLALRVGLALLTALGLASLWHYFDDRLYSAEETGRVLGLPVLACVPRPPRGWRPKSRG
jgi:capsular polysaccharide biosynthesis protein